MLIIFTAIGTIISGSLLWSSLVQGALRLGGSKTLGPKASRIVGLFILPVFLFCLGLTVMFGMLLLGLTLKDAGIDVTGDE